jgi:O-antigen/teichoic acid export membrane protein
VLFALGLAPQAFRVAIFPMMSRLHAAASPVLSVVYEKSFKYLLVVSLPIAAAVMLSAPTVVRLLFRSGFEESATVLQVVIWTFVLLMINVPSARMMIVSDSQRMVALFQGLSMCLNLGLNLILIPRMGVTGAAWARASSTSLFVALGAIYTYNKLNRWQPSRIVVRPMIALFVAFGLGWLLRGLNEVVAMWGSLVIYAVLVWRLGVISQDERAIFTRILDQRTSRPETLMR